MGENLSAAPTIDLSNFSPEAQQYVAALFWGTQVKWDQAVAAVKDLVTHPKEALTDGSVQTLLIEASDVAKAVGTFVPLAAQIGQDLGLAAAVEPSLAQGLIGLASLKPGPAEGYLQPEIEDHFDTNRNPFRVSKTQGEGDD